MPEPQPVFKPLTRSAIFLVVTVHEGGEQTVRDLLSDVPGITRSVGFRVPEGELSCVVGIGSDCWDRLFTGPRPAELHPLPELAGPVHTAVSTPGDLLFHIRSRQMDLCFELASQLMNRLRGVASVVDETHGFKYFEERDLMGFVDGTENPVGPSAERVAVITDQDPGFAGGSYVIVQKYLHDLVAWNELPTEEQERIIGRTKPTNMELPDDVKPANSHVALTSIEEPDGTELQIVRDNMPFGKVGTEEFGTYFIGYSATPAITERMLRNMFLGDPPGNTDRILEFSTAVTGTLFFVPSFDFLEDPPDMPVVATGKRESSLGIGGMKDA
ncbi:Dyp-type peroxidase [Labedaea rhizosphaerae]|uniref:Putative iron-dependent peroxidase n=1 Tax=Labedaea rhizosphaerae TaxID=598644 RepID=A0A4R6S778_LABRH|nr:Dyp-type peroxidase [Labedaea rhizosphaerae]TDP95204.1 putative iron-dependent peroxidase [Labedaea rhizosphaerae]